MAKVISISNQKGGVGKTTTAVNLSSSIAVTNKKVLLIDSDPQGNTTSGLGIHSDKNTENIYDILLGCDDYSRAIRKTEVNNLDLVPSDIHLTGAEIELVGKKEREYRLSEFVRKVNHQYDFIFIDTPPSLGLLTVNALTAADTVLIPLQCEYYALEGLGHLLNSIRMIKTNLNHSLAIEGILFTMFDSRTVLASQVIRDVREHFNSKVLKTVIPRNVRLSEAPSHGKPIMFYDYHSKGAKAYIDLAKEIVTQCKKIA